jgi:hypothetical protein
VLDPHFLLRLRPLASKVVLQAADRHLLPETKTYPRPKT